MLRGKLKSKTDRKAQSESDVESLDDLVRRVDEDRWLAARFAEPAVRARLNAFYAVVYEIARIPESVREPALGLIRLQWWRDAVAAIYSGEGVARFPAAEGLAVLVRETSLDRASLDGLIDARARDLEERPFETWPEFEAYVDATAGAVIRLAARICAPDLVQTRQHLDLFRNAGRVWGYTGLVRSLALWNERRRTFFPQKLLDHVRLTPSELFEGATTHATSSACRAVLERAVAAHKEMRRLVYGAPKEFFPAYGYVAFVTDYMRALDRPYDGAAKVPLLRRQIRLVTASATGSI
ncbi:MAG: squalene/phytoene synthase family protein [Hyphomonadaceae bacterium]|nr:squalene/phytoene synthase family protein [Hyphomonadaceae bacterium]